MNNNIAIFALFILLFLKGGISTTQLFLLLALLSTELSGDNCNNDNCCCHSNSNGLSLANGLNTTRTTTTCTTRTN